MGDFKGNRQVKAKATKPWRKSFGIWVPDKDMRDTRGFIGGALLGEEAGKIYLLACDNITGPVGIGNATDVTFTSAITEIRTKYATTSSPAFGGWDSDTSGKTYGGINFKAA
jgi:hypothetical protein